MRHIEQKQCGREQPQNCIMPSTHTVCIALWIPFNMKRSSRPLGGYSDVDACFKRMEEEKCNGKLDWHHSLSHANGKEPGDLNNLGYCF